MSPGADRSGFRGVQRGDRVSEPGLSAAVGRRVEIETQGGLLGDLEARHRAGQRRDRPAGPARTGSAPVIALGLGWLLLGEQVTPAYRDKYQRYGARYVDPMVSAQARATTIKLVPRSTGS